MTADIYIPFLQISIRAGINRGINISLNVGRKNNFLARSRTLGVHNRNRRHRHLLGLLLEPRLGALARNDAADNYGYDSSKRQNGDPPTPFGLAISSRGPIILLLDV